MKNMNNLQKIYMPDMKQRQPLTYWLLTWDRYIRAVAGVNMFLLCALNPKLGQLVLQHNKRPQDQTFKKSVE